MCLFLNHYDAAYFITEQPWVQLSVKLRTKNLHGHTTCIIYLIICFLSLIFLSLKLSSLIHFVSHHYYYFRPEAKGPLPAKAPLAGTHILLIICAILFLTLLLLGLGVSYLCLNRRTLPAPRRLIDDSSASIISRESIQGDYWGRKQINPIMYM